MRRPTTVEWMLLDDDRPLGAEPHGQPLHPRPRLPAARVRQRPLRARRAGLRVADARGRAVAPDLPPAPPAHRRGGRRPLRQPDRVRLRAQDDDGVRARADPRRDADLRRAAPGSRSAPSGSPSRFWAGAAPLVQRRRARRARLRGRALRRPRRRAARDPHGGDLGGVLDARDAAHADVLRLAHLDRRAVARLGPDHDHRRRAAPVAGLGARLGDLGAPRLRDPRAARRSPTSSGSARSTGSGRRARRSPRTCSPSSRRRSRSCSCPRRSGCSSSPAAC